MPKSACPAIRNGWVDCTLPVAGCQRAEMESGFVDGDD